MPPPYLCGSEGVFSCCDDDTRSMFPASRTHSVSHQVDSGSISVSLTLEVILVTSAVGHRVQLLCKSCVWGRKRFVCVWGGASPAPPGLGICIPPPLYVGGVSTFPGHYPRALCPRYSPTSCPMLPGIDSTPPPTTITLTGIRH